MLKAYRWVDEQIRNAIARGDFERLEGRGKPIDYRAWQNTPTHLRMGYSVMKNAGVVPPEVALRQEMEAIRAALRETTERTERVRLSNRLNELGISLDIRMRRLRRSG